MGAAAYYFRQTLILWYEKAAIFLKEVRVEMQKVVWPSKQDVYGATFVVLVSVVILTIAIGIEDRILSSVLDLILSLAAS
jgi:preprotein translocase subunit SecE